MPAIQIIIKTPDREPEMSPSTNRAYSPDIDMGAYLISHIRQHCENCGTLATPQWRKGWYSDVLNRSVLLCNAVSSHLILTQQCGLKYHKNQFCPYCKYVYGKEHDKVEDGWLICQTCGRWVHLECEKKNNQRLDSNLNYSCPGCRSAERNLHHHT
jgi:hypothetical protein